eukprot:3547999-Pyramimonas_sp.AAC.1
MNIRNEIRNFALNTNIGPNSVTDYTTGFRKSTTFYSADADCNNDIEYSTDTDYNTYASSI